MPATTPQHQSPRKTPWWRRGWVLAVVALLIGIGSASSSTNETGDTAADSTATADTKTVTTTITTTADGPTPSTPATPPAPPAPPAKTVRVTTTPTQPTKTVQVTVRVTPVPKQAIPGDGTFLVGEEVVPGTYRSSGNGSCYYARLSALTGSLDAIIANGNSNGQQIVTIASTDAGFETSGCGGWTNVG